MRGTHDREDVRRLVCDIVQLDAVFRALVVPRNNVLGHALELFKREADKSLITNV